MNAPLYTTEVLRLAASLSEARPLEREHGSADLRSATCGSRIETRVQLDREGRVSAISQRVHACAFGQAASALVERGAPGRSKDEVSAAVEQVTAWLDGADALPGWPGIAALAPARSRKGRHGAILLPFRALLAAMDSTR